MIKKLKLQLPYVIVVVLVLSVFPGGASALVACDATVSPNTVMPGGEAVLQYDIRNTGTDPITSISVQQPTPSYSINGISQAGWIDSTNSTGTTLTGSSLAPGNVYSFQLAMATGPNDEPTANWIITTSSGGAATNCSGQLGTSIASPQAPVVPNGESNIGLRQIGATSATIGWDSVAPSTSYVYYGGNISYGRSASSPGSDSTHLVKLTGLTPNTIYHYKVAGTDGNGNNYFSDDNTFVTPEAPPAIMVPSVNKNPNTEPTIAETALLSHLSIAVPPTPNDTTAPTVALVAFALHPYASSPLIHMTAHDNGALARLDYSTDNGANWLAADHADGLGGKDATASFTPSITEDGNYLLRVRAVDSNGNTATDRPQTLVIDQLPPRFGNLAITFGAQVLDADAQGSLSLATGSVYKFTGHAVGGATNIEMQASNAAGRKKTFSLSLNQDTGLWSGALSFEQAGIYQVSVHAVDGAGNQTDRTIGQVSVIPSGQVIDTHGHTINSATVTLYYLEPSTHHWTIWDGKPYGQINPQPVSKKGYNLMVPAGHYFYLAKPRSASVW